MNNVTATSLSSENGRPVFRLSNRHCIRDGLFLVNFFSVFESYFPHHDVYERSLEVERLSVVKFVDRFPVIVPS